MAFTSQDYAQPKFGFFHVNTRGRPLTDYTGFQGGNASARSLMRNLVGVFKVKGAGNCANVSLQPPCETVLAQRINAGIPAYEAALKAAGKRYTIYVYDNVNHAFNNDTGDRYDKPAADLAWSRTITFFKENLGAPGKA